jgi:hypothetical protein
MHSQQILAQCIHPPNAMAAHWQRAAEPERTGRIRLERASGTSPHASNVRCKQQPGRALGQSCLPVLLCSAHATSAPTIIPPRPRCRRRNLAVAAAAASHVRSRRCRNFIFPPILKPRVGRDADDTVATFLTHAALRFRDCCGVGDRTGQAGRRA